MCIGYIEAKNLNVKKRTEQITKIIWKRRHKIFNEWEKVLGVL